jgi:transcriptional regulator with XRE-family HTH domain
MLYPNLKIALQTRRLTQRHLAVVLRVSPQTLSDRLNGIGELAPHEWERIAEFLGFDAAWLLEPLHIPARAGYKPREFAVLTPALEARG